MGSLQKILSEVSQKVSYSLVYTKQLKIPNQKELAIFFFLVGKVNSDIEKK